MSQVWSDNKPDLRAPPTASSDSTYLEIDRFPAPRQGLVVSKEAGVDLNVVCDDYDENGGDHDHDDSLDNDDDDEDKDDNAHLSLIH